MQRKYRDHRYLLIDYSGKESYFCSNIHNRDVSIDYNFFRYDFLGNGEVRNKIEIVPGYISEYISSSTVNNFPIISYRIFLFDENSIRFDKPLGMAVISMRADFFKTAYQDSNRFKGTIYVLNRDGLTLFDSSGNLSGQLFPFQTFLASGLSDLKTNFKSIVNKRDSEETGFVFVDIVDKRIVSKETEGIRTNINNVIAVCIALTMTICFISASMISKRIKSLVKNMKAVESGKLDTRITVRSNDEIGYLEHGFNSMCAKLAESIRAELRFIWRSPRAENRQHIGERNTGRALASGYVQGGDGKVCTGYSSLMMSQSSAKRAEGYHRMG